MEQINQVYLNYSLKNIPIPSINSYKKKLIGKVEDVIKRMRWKAFFFLKEKSNEIDEEKTDIDTTNYGFKSKKCPPQIEELRPFEDDMMKMIESVQGKRAYSKFQETLRQDIRKIRNSTKMLIPADKTRNLYELDKSKYDKLLEQNITKSYKCTSETAYADINMEAKAIAEELNIDDRMEVMAKKEAFISLKDHKENFENTLPCRLINPAKSEMGRVSKKIIEAINKSLRSITQTNQWRNSGSVIEWFNKIPDKSKHSFTIFDIVDFYPSISEELLEKAINFAKQKTPVSDQDIEIILHSRKSLLFAKGKIWTKKNNQTSFDVTMGSFDGAEVCELVGLYILDTLAKKYKKENIGLYRDDGLAIFKNASGRAMDKIRKDIVETFKLLGLKITISTNLKTVNFLDLTLNLDTGKYYPFRKPNDHPLYINKESNHPPTIIKNLPASISRRVSDISYDEEIFRNSAPYYENALKSSGYAENLSYETTSGGTPLPSNKKSRQRRIIWFNPPYSQNIQTNIGGTFLRLIAKHFPPRSKLSKIFNKNTLKVSYSCMPNMLSAIKAHNQKILKGKEEEKDKPCNCRNKDKCPLRGNCQETNVVYKAEIEEENNIINNITGNDNTNSNNNNNNNNSNNKQQQQQQQQQNVHRSH